MTGRLCVVVAAGLALAGCAGQLAAWQGPPTSERPGTQITLRNPDTTKWQPVVPPGPRGPGRPSLWACRPIMCSDAAMISAQTIPSPTRDPDSKALQTAAKLLAAQTRAQDIMLEAASDGENRVTALSNKVTQVRGYPAITAEMKSVTGKRIRYLVRGELFVGLFIVKVLSVSDRLQEANRNFDSLVAAMEIVDVPPSGSAAAEAPPVAFETGGAAPESTPARSPQDR